MSGAAWIEIKCATTPRARQPRDKKAPPKKRNDWLPPLWECYFQNATSVNKGKVQERKTARIANTCH